MYSINPSIWLPCFIFLLMIVQSVYSVRRRGVPGTLLFSIGCLFAALWSTGSVMEMAAAEVTTKIFWVKFQAIWLLPATTCITCFILEYTWPRHWLTRRRLIIFSIVPLLALGFILTNDLHHLIWQDFFFDGMVIPIKGAAVGYFMAYSYALSLINLVIFIYLFIRSPQHRWPVIIMLIGQIGVRLVYYFQSLNAVQPDLPFDLLGIGFLFLTYAIALFAFRIFDPIPMAFQKAIEQLQTGMLVLDSNGVVINLNSTVEKMLGIPSMNIKGRIIQEVLPAYPDRISISRDGFETEFDFYYGKELRNYSLKITTLTDWRGFEVGRLLLLNDITRQKHSQLQIIEQQRSLAKLQERENLARELHDSVGQVLGYISLQSQAIQKLLNTGEFASAEKQLARLILVAQDAHVDLRDSILSLRSTTPEKWTFLSALENYLAAFQNNYGIQTEMFLSPDLSENDFAPGAGVQLVRIIQEVLTNSRKHSGASKVWVVLDREDFQASITVTDNGSGFEIGSLPSNNQNHYGLTFMQERAALIGGSLVIHSELGEGTKVIIRVPIDQYEKVSL